MTTIYLVRHAEAEGNLYRIAQGQYNSALTDRGWRQVGALERRFADIHIDAVYSSDLYRTCATASSIYQAKGLPLHRTKDLREICVGVWEHRSWGDIARSDPQQLEYFRTEVWKWNVPGGESPYLVQARMLAAVKRIGAAHDGQTIALFSHGYAIRLLLAAVEGYAMEEFFKTPTGDNTAVSCLELDGDALRVVFRDDNSHLTAPEFAAEEKQLKRAISVEPGLRYEVLRLPEQAEVFRALAAEGCADAGAAYDEEAFTSCGGTTLLGLREDEPVGIAQVSKDGELTLLCVRRDLRCRSYGVQLLGQTVQYARGNGCDTMHITLPEGCGTAFFTDYGFVPAGGGRMEKNIAFAPEYL